MRAAGNSFAGNGGITKRVFQLAAAIVAGQVVCKVDGTRSNIGDPASVNDYTEMVGIVVDETPPTYSTTQGTGANTALRRAAVQCNPFMVIRGRVSGGVTAGTAFAAALNGNILTNSTADATGLTVADTNVGTSEFVSGVIVGLTGQNAGHVRECTAHTDDTSTAVTVPFDYTLAANDTFLRTNNVFNQGIELTTNFVQFNGTPGAAVDLPDTGQAIIFEVIVDIGQSGDPHYIRGNQGTTAAPLVFFDWISADHVYNSLA